jgi:hypothetical protein
MDVSVNEAGQDIVPPCIDRLPRCGQLFVNPNRHDLRPVNSDASLK